MTLSGARSDQPDAEPYRVAAETLNVAPRYMLGLGDATSDVRSAKKAGVN